MSEAQIIIASIKEYLSISSATLASWMGVHEKTVEKWVYQENAKVGVSSMRILRNADILIRRDARFMTVEHTLKSTNWLEMLKAHGIYQHNKQPKKETK